MKTITVADAIELYKKQTDTRYSYIIVSDPFRGNYSTLKFEDVYGVKQEGDILSFYGKPVKYDIYGTPHGNYVERYVRITNSKIVYSEV